MVIIADEPLLVSQTQALLGDGFRTVRVGEAVCVNPFGVGILRRDGERWAWDDMNGYWYGPVILPDGSRPGARKKVRRG